MRVALLLEALLLAALLLEALQALLLEALLLEALQALLPQVGRPLSELVLVATGDVVLVFNDDTVFEAITGQEWVFEVADFEREVSRYRAQGGGADASAATDVAEVAADADPLDDVDGAALPARPGPRAAQPANKRRVKDWSRTG